MPKEAAKSDSTVSKLIYVLPLAYFAIPQSHTAPRACGIVIKDVYYSIQIIIIINDRRAQIPRRG